MSDNYAELRQVLKGRSNIAFYVRWLGGQAAWDVYIATVSQLLAERDKLYAENKSLRIQISALQADQARVCSFVDKAHLFCLDQWGIEQHKMHAVVEGDEK